MYKGAVFLGYVTSILAIISGIFLQPYLLKTLGDNDYIFWTNILIVLGYFSNGFVGIQTYLTMIVSKTKSLDFAVDLLVDVKKTIILLSGMLFILILLFRPVFHYINADILSSKIFIICLFLLLFRVYCESKLSLLSGMQKPIYPKIYEFFIKLSSIIVIILICYKNIGLQNALFFYFLAQAIIAVFLNIAPIVNFSEKEKKKKSVIFEYKKIKNIILYSLPYLAISIPQSFLQTIDILILSKHLDTTIVTSFLFYIKIFSVVIISQNIMMSIFYPKWAGYISDGNLRGLNISFYGINFFLISSVLFIYSIMILFGSDIMTLWTGNNNIYIGGYDLMFIMILFLCYVIRTSYYFLSNAIGVNKNDVIICWVEAFVHILLSLLFIKYWGLKGCISGAIISSFIGIYYYQKKKDRIMSIL